MYDVQNGFSVEILFAKKHPIILSVYYSSNEMNLCSSFKLRTEIKIQFLQLRERVATTHGDDIDKSEHGFCYPGTCVRGELHNIFKYLLIIIIIYIYWFKTFWYVYS